MTNAYGWQTDKIDRVVKDIVNPRINVRFEVFSYISDKTAETVWMRITPENFEKIKPLLSMNSVD